MTGVSCLPALLLQQAISGLGSKRTVKSTPSAAHQGSQERLGHECTGTRDRKQKKRDMRSLWIQQINAGAKEHGVPYSKFMNGLASDNISLNRKVLAELAANEPLSFQALVQQVKFMRGL
ncbi:hypothetical protein WJX74_003417 [Apatococcus lobatus]|uniref:50S ribosomal protein L20 n=1 Tax=Apatococcus lobatus TaxID=904363 RepID=A0AAW1S3A6_9CHLO